MKKITGLLKRMLCLVLCAMMALGLNTTTYANWTRASKKQWTRAVKSAKKKFVLKPTEVRGDGEEDPYHFLFDDLIATEFGYFTVSIEADEPVMTRVICREITTIGGGQEYFDLSFDEPVKEYKADKTFKIRDRANVYFIVCTTDPDVEVKVTVKGVKHSEDMGNYVAKTKPVKFVIDQW